MRTDITRRSFVKGNLLSSASLALALPGSGQEQPQAAEPGPAPAPKPAALPKGKIGKLEVSRLILAATS